VSEQIERKHPDIFTPEEAAAYLHLLPEEGVRTLKTLREKNVLRGFWLGPTFMYHKRDLDLAADQIFGIVQPIQSKPRPQRSGPRLRIHSE
jgi:hypothetical protein